MSVEIDTSGLDKLIKNAKELESEREVRMDELFSPEFMRNCSSFTSFDEMVDSSGFKVESKEDFKAIPDDEWDDFISKNTSYKTWEQMQQEAGEDYTQRLLFKGL